jgi:hypothetical protein
LDAIQFKREAQLKIYEETRGKAHTEVIEYFRKQAEAGPLGEWWKLVKGPETPSGKPSKPGGTPTEG